MQAGRIDDDEAQFQREHKREPANGWSRYGLAELHKAQYGFAIEHEVIELVNFRVTAIGKIDAPSMALTAGSPARRPARSSCSGGSGNHRPYRRGSGSPYPGSKGPTVPLLSDEPLMLAHGLEKPHSLLHHHPHG